MTKGTAQMKLSSGETFLNGMPMKKVFVSIEDHAVWALSIDGKVYLKKEADPDFQIYPLTAGIIVSEITGFNADDIYFLATPKIIQIKAGVKTELIVPFAGVTRINSISVVHVKKAYFNGGDRLPVDDWIAIATNTHMYMYERAGTKAMTQFPYDNIPYNIPEPDWQISNASFNTVDFRYKSPSGRCFEADYATTTNKDELMINTIIPDKGAYPPIKCTLYSNQYYRPFTGNPDWKTVYNFWGTNDGLYVKDAQYCFAGLVIRKVISGAVINDLEEIGAITPIYKQNFVLAATNHGLYYTPKSIDHENSASPDINRINFIRFSAIDENVNSVCSDTKLYGSINVSSQYTYSSICQKVIWVATSKGIKKVFVELDQDYYDKFLTSELNFSIPKTNSDDEKAVFEICGEQTVTVSTRLPAQFQNQIMIKWFHDGVERAELTGKTSVVLQAAGTYQVKITALCEGITISSIPILIKQNTDPDITLDYAQGVTLCESNYIVLNTINKPGYRYRWFKNDILINSENNSGLYVNSPGNYRVEVSNCGDYYKSSSAVEVRVPVLPVPRITSDKLIYCKGESARLSIAQTSTAQVKWYYNGVEQNDFQGKTEIVTALEGSYKAVFINEAGCTKESVPYNFIGNDIPAALITRSTNRSLCNGETVRLSTAALNGAVYRWNTGETSSSIQVTAAGQYFVEVTSASGCSKISEVTTVEFIPPIVLNQPDEVRLCTLSGEIAKLKAASGYLNYTWNGNRGTDFLDVTVPGQYNLEIEDEFGCKATTTYLVIPFCKEVLMPNTFSPNGDGINDYWTIGGLENDPEARFSIYNRNGSLVFEGRGSNPVWDGKFKGSNLPLGVYYYLINTRNSVSPIKGWVTIIR